MNYPPIEGSPLIPPDILTLYFALFLLFLAVVYLILRFKANDIGIKQRLKKVFLLGIIIKFLVLGGGGLLAAYWFIPSPHIIATSPKLNSDLASPTQKIEIFFDRPVSRKFLEKTITPDVAGVWVFEEIIYKTHLSKKVSFYPTESLDKDTEYKITLSNIKNAAGISNPYSHQFSFKTQQQPKVSKIEPEDGSNNIAVDSKVLISLISPNDALAEFDFEIEPNIPFDTSLNESKTEYSLKFKENLKQGTKYSLKVKKTDISINPQNREVLTRGETKEDYSSNFTTKPPPGIELVSPTGTNVTLNSPISLKFSTPMDKKSVEDNFQIEPPVEGELTWASDQTLEFQAQKLDYETTYKVIVHKGAKSLDGGFFEEDSVSQFSTIGPVKVISTNPSDGWTAVSINNPIKITFDQEVDKPSVQERFSISPSIDGDFSWDQNTLIFTPSQKLDFSTKYILVLKTGIKGIQGLSSKSDFSFLFTTQNQTVKLAVPALLQQHSLSCEVAALKMALLYRGINVSEETLLAQVGVDPTPHQGNIWGNPYQAFVGNVDGKQMIDGFGVYWGPIAKAARNYRGAQEFEGWSVNQLTDALLADNPVVIWVYAGSGGTTSWNTPTGEKIFALRNEHAVTAVGFVGKADNPTQVIVNDPLIGQVYWSRASFDNKWNSYGRSGVVIF